MSDAEADRRSGGPARNLLLVGIAVVAAGIGGFIGRGLAPAQRQQASPSERNPIVEIVRPDAGLPSLADTIGRLCPSMAVIRAPGSAPPASPAKDTANGAAAAAPASVPAFAISAQGWLVTSSDLPDTDHLQAVFGNGATAAVSEIRNDPVSGLAIAKVAATELTPVTLADRDFPRVGDFGFAITTPEGSGCSAVPAMIGSDFLADGGGLVSYVRLSSGAADIAGATPFVAGNGRVIAIAAPNALTDDALLPAPVAATIIDELIRGSVSPTTAFGFRAADFTQLLSARVGDQRSRGAGIALVQPRSAADRAGLKAGDVVVAVNGSPVSSASELGRAMDAVEKSATLDVIRGDQRLTLSIARPARDTARKETAIDAQAA